MLLTRESSRVNVVSAWNADGIRIGEEWLRQHVIISAQTIIRDWPVHAPEHVRLEDLSAAVALEPQVLLLGTGPRLMLPQMDLMQALGAKGIGLEIMDTPAACRTYNVLVHENRRVVAALFSMTR
ncbi:MAG TPA: MTH938/NDUFAF3 family protein [Gammaproteobacteria bacterium]